ncbi:MAG TPA: glycogen/starch synthase [Candidatus Methylomirabilis sp.]|jgi:starch synthase
MDTFRVLMAASEVAPLAQTGGLGQAVGELARALRRQGHDVRVVLPGYAVAERAAEAAGMAPATRVERLPVPLGEHLETSAVREAALPGGVPAYLLSHPRYYHREALYATAQGDYADNAERFIYFSRSILALARATDFVPDVLHCHDWQTGLVPAYLKLVHGGDAAFDATGTVFTVHNLAYQGLFWHYDMHLIGLSWDIFTPEGIEFYGKINLLKAGLVYADAVAVPSPRYAQEIQTPEHGWGLEGMLRARAEDVVGILGGLDTEVWDPGRDPHLAAPYGPEDLAGKRACKDDLLRAAGLPAAPEAPLLGWLGPLTAARGGDLFVEALEDLVGLGARVVTCGVDPEEADRALARSAERLPQAVAILPGPGRDEGAAHRLIAGCDILVCPARSEASGTHALAALRYGTPPLARAAGALADAVSNYDARTGSGTGFVFKEASASDLVRAAQRALGAHRQPAAWAALVRRAMAQDVGWDRPARAYAELYARVLTRRRA